MPIYSPEHFETRVGSREARNRRENSAGPCHYSAQKTPDSSKKQFDPRREISPLRLRRTELSPSGNEVENGEIDPSNMQADFKCFKIMKTPAKMKRVFESARATFKTPEKIEKVERRESPIPISKPKEKVVDSFFDQATTQKRIKALHERINELELALGKEKTKKDSEEAKNKALLKVIKKLEEKLEAFEMRVDMQERELLANESELRGKKGIEAKLIEALSELEAARRELESKSAEITKIRKEVAYKEMMSAGEFGYLKGNEDTPGLAKDTITLDWQQEQFTLGKTDFFQSSLDEKGLFDPKCLDSSRRIETQLFLKEENRQLATKDQNSTVSFRGKPDLNSSNEECTDETVQNRRKLKREFENDAPVQRERGLSSSRERIKKIEGIKEEFSARKMQKEIYEERLSAEKRQTDKENQKEEEAKPKRRNSLNESTDIMLQFGKKSQTSWKKRKGNDGIFEEESEFQSSMEFHKGAQKGKRKSEKEAKEKSHLEEARKIRELIQDIKRKEKRDSSNEKKEGESQSEREILEDLELLGDGERWKSEKSPSEKSKRESEEFSKDSENKAIQMSLKEILSGRKSLNQSQAMRLKTINP